MEQLLKKQKMEEKQSSKSVGLDFTFLTYQLSDVGVP
jgi:hypothetical protein